MNMGTLLLCGVTHMHWNCEVVDITEFENARRLRIQTVEWKKR